VKHESWMKFVLADLNVYGLVSIRHVRASFVEVLPCRK